MHVLIIASEVIPFSKTGGLADVTGALPRALANRGARVTVVTPRYESIDPVAHSLARRLRTLTVPIGADTVEVGVYEGSLPGSHARVYLLDHPPSYGRPHPYGEEGGDYPDNPRRFALLCRGALEVTRDMGGWPDIVHAFDWQGALAPLMIRRGWFPGTPRTGCVFTVHNLAFQGLYPAHFVDELGLGRDLFHPEGLEFYGDLNLLKAGVLFADRTTTVSPKYAREIQTPEYGCGLDGLLRSRGSRLSGILNGVDYDVWDPRRDPILPKTYGPDDLAGKAICKEALQKAFGLPLRPTVPLIGAVSRLTEQKGFDLVAEIAEDLARLDVQLAILGAGAKDLEARLTDVARRFPNKLAGRIAFDDRLAHLVEAGSDMFLIPSRFEPCGLTQMYSLRYGSIPIARAVGGLDDTIVDYDPRSRTGNGFKFEEYSGPALLATIRRALNAYNGADAWRETMLRGMRLDYSWDIAGRRYLETYEEILKELGPA
ncbi:MAG: glycogen synthase GlgA [Deltaproteobacteria bacterium]|nr:glycogen synthase GlgA [Deltaproteobacteria bacterium]